MPSPTQNLTQGIKRKNCITLKRKETESRGWYQNSQNNRFSTVLNTLLSSNYNKNQVILKIAFFGNFYPFGGGICHGFVISI